MGFSLSGSRRWIYHVATLAILAGLVLSLVSWLNICTEECAQTHKYKIFGVSFESLGIPFFILLLICHLLSRKYVYASVASIILAASALGAEVMFILIQKYTIGTWCPICLSIAACVAVIATCYGIGYFQELTQSLNPFYKGEYMKIGWRGIASLSAFAFGFLFAFVGVSKSDALQAAENSVKNEMWFGVQSSPVEVYLFTDWACPACRKLEPAIEGMLPEVAQKAKFMFVDFAIHPETYNYSPFNVAFVVNNKRNYMQIRHALTKLSEDNGSPTEEQIKKVAQSVGAQYKPLNFADVALASKHFKELGKKFDIEATPMMVIVNVQTKKGKKLSGLNEITKENVLKTISSLQ